MNLRGKTSGSGLGIQKYKCQFGHITRRVVTESTNFIRCSKMVFSKGLPMTCERVCERVA